MNKSIRRHEQFVGAKPRYKASKDLIPSL